MFVIYLDVSDRNLFNMLGLYLKFYQINRASVLKHVTLAIQNCIDNIGNGFVH